MTEQDKPAFSAAMMGAGEVYNREISKQLLQIYFATLSRLSIEQVEGAMASHMRDPQAGQFFPKPADLIRQIAGTQFEQHRAIEDRAALAWACIDHQIRSKGAYGTLTLDDKQALATVKAMGGWRDLCMRTTEQLVWARKEFISMYKSFERTPLEALPENLPGLIALSQHKSEASNQLKSLSEGLAAFGGRGMKRLGGPSNAN